ncbi:hypothetical protein MUP77_09935 [Candidatus Bathyarchaeota archaeon]|nr:hypothetical protein [Candidatus Bathyarchaeota archaeon]
MVVHILDERPWKRLTETGSVVLFRKYTLVQTVDIATFQFVKESIPVNVLVMKPVVDIAEIEPFVVDSGFPDLKAVMVDFQNLYHIAGDVGLSGERGYLVKLSRTNSSEKSFGKRGENVL